MDVKKVLLGAALAASIGSVAGAADPYQGRYETFSPAVTQASCECESLSCDAGCSSSACDSCFDNACGDGCLGASMLGCDSCGGGCDGCCGGRDDGLLGYGLVKHSDRCFDDFISPMTNPVFFEDPRTLSEVRFIFLNHELPAALGATQFRFTRCKFAPR
ncbi:MAG: hypothetical protein R3C53_07240 [Pirellulaceae bacterium]